MTRLARILLGLKAKPMVPEHRPPEPALGELDAPAQGDDHLYTEDKTSHYISKRKTALREMFGPGDN